MNALENYKTVLEKYFGAGAATFDTTGGEKNNFTGALNSPDDYAAFKASFPKRLERLLRDDIRPASVEAATFSRQRAKGKHAIDYGEPAVTG